MAGVAAVKKVRAKYVKALIAACGEEMVIEAMHCPAFLGRLNVVCHKEAEGHGLEPMIAARVLAMSVAAYCGKM